MIGSREALSRGCRSFGLQEDMRMADVGYVWEKVSLTVDALCGGAGPFDERMANAYHSQLCWLNQGDGNAEIADDLNDVLRMMDAHFEGGRREPFAEEERFAVASKLVHILIVTSRLTGEGK
jgi:hypothetical protein